MKLRIVIYGGVLILVILAIFCGRHSLERTTTQIPVETVHSADNVPAAPNTFSSTTVPGYSNVIAVVIPPMRTTLRGTNKITAEEVATRFIEGKNVPVEFYGQVIDQDSNGLAGVDVKVIVMRLTMPDPAVPALGSENIPLERISGSDGRFEISGQVGASFDLESIQKDGYEAEPVKRGRSPTGGTFDQPVVFKMWSTNIHEHLISGEKSFQIVPDGRPYFIDFTAGSISESESGELRVLVKYADKIERGRLYDWSCQIGVVNGGLLEEPLGTAMYLAPADGYIPAFQQHGQVKGGQRGATGERHFYVMLMNGLEYGQIAIDVDAPYNDDVPGMIRLSYVVNPSGSRILR